MPVHEAEEFWEELLAQIEAGQVIPVVGPEILTLVVDGRELSLYRALAERLLAKYGVIACGGESGIGPYPENAAPRAPSFS